MENNNPNRNHSNTESNNDFFEKSEKFVKNNKKKVIAAAIAATALIVGGVFLHKNNKEKDPINNPDEPHTQTEQPNDETSTTETPPAEIPQDKDPNTTMGDSTDTDYTEIYEDPGSGDTVITNPNKTPENVMGHDIATLGFTKLLDMGVSKEQVDKLKSYFLEYSNGLETPINEVSIDSDSIEKLVEKGSIKIDFEVKVDRKSTLDAEVQYSGLYTPSLKLFDNEGKLVFSIDQ